MNKKRGKSKKLIRHQIETVVLDADFEEAETTCCICYAEFIDPEDLQMHISQVHVNSYVREKCGFCEATFKSLENLTIHIRDEHLTSLLLCTYCFRTFIDSNEFILHQKLHLSNSALQSHSCSNCKETFKYRKDLESHEIENHYDCGPGVFLHKCFALLSAYLNVHVVAFLQSLATDTVYICGSCNYTNPYAESYISHLKKSGCKSNACDKCFKVFSSKKYLMQHIRSNKECMHSPNEIDLGKICNKCNKQVPKEIYAEHRKLCPFSKCDICRITFESPEMFAVHQMKNHKNAINVTTCKYCRKQYVGNVSLQKHIDRMHSKELHLYKYSCTECNYSFKHPKHLFSHFFSRHPNMKPFTCNICDKSFKQRKKFSIHIKMSHNSQGTVTISDDSHVYFTEKPTDIDSERAKSCEDDAIADLSEDNTKADLSEDNTKADLSEDNIVIVDETPANQEKTLTTVDESETNNEAAEDPLTTKPKRILKRKLKKRKLSVDSDDEPLTKKLNRKIPNWKIKNGSRLQTRYSVQDKKNFTCPKCNKYCYTFRNYKQHMSLHSKNISLTCIKCDAVFKSENELKKHVTSNHSHSQLTETLKTVLEKRNKFQNNQSLPLKEFIASEKFRNTIKKVTLMPNTESAVLTEVKTGLSKFLESFTPENPKRKIDIKISANVCIKTIENAPQRPPLMKMHNFVPPPQHNKDGKIKLAMPVKCKFPSTVNQPKATITVASSDYVSNFSLKLNSTKQYKEEKSEQTSPLDTDVVNSDHAYAHDTHNDYEDPEEQAPAIPEVAEEVMLAASEDTSKPKYTHKLVLPNIPECFSKVHIGHLLPEAPYYKIINVTDLINKSNNIKEVQPEVVPEEPVTLPSGTKLVNVNPLEHLLKDASVMENDRPKNTKIKDYSTAVAKALLKLERKTPVSSTKKKPKKAQKPKSLSKKSLQMLGYLNKNDGTTAKKNKRRGLKKNTEETELLLVESQDTTNVDEMELVEEYLEDILSDEEILEETQEPVTDGVKDIPEEISQQHNTNALSLPEL